MTENIIRHVMSGCGSFQELLKLIQNKKTVVFTTKTPYTLLRDLFPGNVSFVLLTNKEKQLNEILRSPHLKDIDYIIGMGGGTSIDLAKIVGYMLQKSVIALPTMLSCNAFSTNKATILQRNKVTTIVAKIPDLIVADWIIIEKAGRRFNLAGCSEILSISIALRDWQLSHHLTGEHYDVGIAHFAFSLVELFYKHFDEIIRLTENGFEILFRLLMHSGYVTNIYGSGRPESGSEHIFARAVETDRELRGNLLHGEAVALGILLIQTLYGVVDVSMLTSIDKLGLLDQIRLCSLTKAKLLALLKKSKHLRKDRFTLLQVISNQDICACVDYSYHHYLTNETPTVTPPF